MSGNKRKVNSGSEISFSELKQLAEDGDAIAQNKLAFFGVMQPGNRMNPTPFSKIRKSFRTSGHEETSRAITVKGCDELGMDGTRGTTR